MSDLGQMLGIYGAATATIALLLSLRNWWHDRVWLKVQAEVMPNGLSLPPSELVIRVIAISKGRRPVTPVAASTTRWPIRGVGRSKELLRFSGDELTEGRSKLDSVSIPASDLVSIRSVYVEDATGKRWSAFRIRGRLTCRRLGTLAPVERFVVDDVEVERYCTPRGIEPRNRVKVAYPTKQPRWQATIWGFQNELEAKNRFEEMRQMDSSSLRALQEDLGSLMRGGLSSWREVRQ